MSDIASPLLVVQKEEAQAYLCFCGLMKRLRTNFMYDGEAITTKLQHLSSLMEFYDPEFHTYMQDHGAEDMFFCYRWLLLEMKREFPFDDALYMLEVMWSTIPPSPPEEELELYDKDYSPTLLVSISPNSPSVALKTQYGHLLAKRLRNVARDTTSGRSPRPRNSPVKSPVDSALSDIKEENANKQTVNDINADKKPSPVDNDSAVDIEKEVDNAADNVKSTVSDVDTAFVKQLSDDAVKSPEDTAVIKTKENVNVTSEIELVTHDKVQNISQTELEANYRVQNTSQTELESNYKVQNTNETRLEASDKVQNNSDESLNTCNKDSDEGVANTSTGSSNSSSYMSASQSVERFPSLISASVEESSTSVDDNTESKTLTDSIDVIDGPFQNASITQMKHMEPVHDCNHSNQSDENDDQSQFHLSLEETVAPEEKKKSGVPQIKGSFFSGMKKFLASPKRLPGRAQPAGNGSEIIQNNNKTNMINNTDSNGSSNVKKNKKPGVRRSLSVNGEDFESEHTLFEVNNMIKSMSALPVEHADNDSGMGSLTSSTNSLHSRGNRARSANHDAISTGKPNHDKSGDVLTKEQQDFIDKKYKDTIMNMTKNSSTPNTNKPPSFCDDYFSLNNPDSGVNDKDHNGAKDSAVTDSSEAVDSIESKLSRFRQLPCPEDFGYGNPFLMFLCLTVLVQHRDVIIKTGMEYDEFAMYFDKMVRKHNVNKVLHLTRTLYTEYIRMQQKLHINDDDSDFSV